MVTACLLASVNGEDARCAFAEEEGEEGRRQVVALIERLRNPCR
jgi:hypothetical protein